MKSYSVFIRTILFSIIFLFFGFTLLSPQIFAEDSTQSSSNKVEVYFFWGKGCPHCAKEKSFLEGLEKKYPQLELKEFEVYYNRENQELFQRVAAAYKTSASGVPMTFIGKNFVLGFDSAQNTGKKIEALIQDCLQKTCPTPKEILEKGIEFQFSGHLESQVSSLPNQQDLKEVSQNKTSSSKPKEEFSIEIFGKKINLHSSSPLYVLGMVLGLADGINPCMFSVLLFLLTYLLAIGSRRKTLKAGLAFTLTAFFVYLLFMMGLINLITLIGFLAEIKIIVGVIALVAGIIMIKDFFFYGRWFSLEIPSRAKPFIEKLIKRGTVPSAVLLALFSSLVELPCTSGIPLVYVTLLAQKGGSYLFYLLWYNIFFILPLLVIIMVVSFAWTQVEKIEKWRVSFRKYMRLIAGLILLFLALALLRGWL